MGNWHTRLNDLLERQKKKDKKFTKAYVAKKVGVEPSSVSDWCTGKTKEINGENLIRLCDLLNVDPHLLMFGKSPTAIYMTDAQKLNSQLSDAHKNAIEEVVSIMSTMPEIEAGAILAKARDAFGPLQESLKKTQKQKIQAA